MTDTREVILVAAYSTAQAHGYSALNFRTLATEVGVTSASVHHHFPTKADLGVAIAKRDFDNARTELRALSNQSTDAAACLELYPGLFRKTLCDGFRMCLHNFMVAEHHDLPNRVRFESDLIADFHVEWLAEVLREADPGMERDVSGRRARAIFAAVSGAQLVARGRANVFIFDEIMRDYRDAGLFRV